MTQPRRWLFAVDALLLLALAVYVLAGVLRTPYHGDEGMQIYASVDYITTFIERNPADLLTNPPYIIDSRPHLRLINGTVHRYSTGFVLYTLRGHNEGDLPVSPGWNWGLSYEDNVAGGWLPKDSILYPSRYSSAVYFALSVGVVFALAWQFGGRWAAYPAAVLYALNPVLLLNGRRAMLEGSQLFFGMMTLLVAALLAKRIAAGERAGWGWWLWLTVSGGLAIASKHSAAIYPLGAWLWVFAAAVIAAVAGRRWRPLLVQTALLALTGVVAIALFIVASPALWNDPPARLMNLVETRTEMLNIQINADPNAPTPLSGRVMGLFTQPYIAPLAYFEVASWAEADDIVNQIQQYEASGLRGLPDGYLLGVPLMLLALVGLVMLVWGARVSRVYLAQAVGLLLWLGVTVAALLLNPLPWQRYYLPYIPIVVLLSSIGLATGLKALLSTVSNTTHIAGERVVGQTD